MSNPYRIETPFIVSFSGGATSGFMLRKILDAYEGELPGDGRARSAPHVRISAR